MINKILCLFNVLYALNVEGMYYIINRFVRSIDNLDQFIINVCERLKDKNVFYVKAIQAASSNNEVFSEKVRNYMKIMVDQVPYKSNEYDVDKLKNILENKLFKTFVLFSVFRAIYGALVLFISYFLSTSYDDGILFTILFLVISFIFSRYMFKKLKPKFNL